MKLGTTPVWFRYYKVTVDELLADGKPFHDIIEPEAMHPDWRLDADGNTAYLQLLNDSRLLRIDLGGAVGKPAMGESLGNRMEGKHPDSRGSISIGPNGKVCLGGFCTTPRKGIFHDQMFCGVSGFIWPVISIVSE